MSLASEFQAQASHPTAPLALMGGTFDPVHWGHLRVASETAAALRLPELRLVPSKTPVHRTRPDATEAQRFDMLELGISALNDPALRADGAAPWPPVRGFTGSGLHSSIFLSGGAGATSPGVGALARWAQGVAVGRLKVEGAEVPGPAPKGTRRRVNEVTNFRGMHIGACILTTRPLKHPACKVRYASTRAGPQQGARVLPYFASPI